MTELSGKCHFLIKENDINSAKIIMGLIKIMESRLYVIDHIIYLDIFKNINNLSIQDIQSKITKFGDIYTFATDLTYTNKVSPTKIISKMLDCLQMDNKIKYPNVIQKQNNDFFDNLGNDEITMILNINEHESIIKISKSKIIKYTVLITDYHRKIAR